MRITNLSNIPLAACATACLLVTSATAADLVVGPSVVPAHPIQPSDAGMTLAVEDWTGFYVGASVGGVTSDDFEEENTAWSGAAQAGYLQQFGGFVLGGELQAALFDELTYVLTPDAGLTQNWSVSATGRAGVALGQTLLYGAGGFALAELEPAGATTSDSDTYIGAVLGAGIEQSFGQLSLRAEYLQTNFFDVESAVGGVAREDDLTSHAIMVGINFRP